MTGTKKGQISGKNGIVPPFILECAISNAKNSAGKCFKDTLIPTITPRDYIKRWIFLRFFFVGVVSKFEVPDIGTLKI